VGGSGSKDLVGNPQHCRLTSSRWENLELALPSSAKSSKKIMKKNNKTQPTPGENSTKVSHGCLVPVMSGRGMERDKRQGI